MFHNFRQPPIEAKEFESRSSRVRTSIELVTLNESELPHPKAYLGMTNMALPSLHNGSVLTMTDSPLSTNLSLVAATLASRDWGSDLVNQCPTDSSLADSDRNAEPDRSMKE